MNAAVNTSRFDAVWRDAYDALAAGDAAPGRGRASLAHGIRRLRRQAHRLARGGAVASRCAAMAARSMKKSCGGPRPGAAARCLSTGPAAQSFSILSPFPAARRSAAHPHRPLGRSRCSARPSPWRSTTAAPNSLRVLQPDVKLVGEGGALVSARDVAPAGAGKPAHYIVEYVAGRPLPDFTPDRSTRIIVRFADEDVEYDALVRALRRSLGGGRGGRAVFEPERGRQCPPPARPRLDGEGRSRVEGGRPARAS